MLGQLGHVPEISDEVRLGGYLVRVDDGDGPSVAQVVFRLADEEREGDPSLQ